MRRKLAITQLPEVSSEEGRKGWGEKGGEEGMGFFCYIHFLYWTCMPQLECASGNNVLIS